MTINRNLNASRAEVEAGMDEALNEALKDWRLSNGDNFIFAYRKGDSIVLSSAGRITDILKIAAACVDTAKDAIAQADPINNAVPVLAVIQGMLESITGKGLAPENMPNTEIRSLLSN